MVSGARHPTSRSEIARHGLGCGTWDGRLSFGPSWQDLGNKVLRHCDHLPAPQPTPAVPGAPRHRNPLHGRAEGEMFILRSEAAAGGESRRERDIALLPGIPFFFSIIVRSTVSSWTLRNQVTELSRDVIFNHAPPPLDDWHLDPARGHFHRAIRQ